MKSVDCYVPETMLAVAPGAEAGMPIDAINAACTRADAVLQLLQANFEGSEVRCSNSVILAALWDVQGTLGLIKTLAMHGYTSTHQAMLSSTASTSQSPNWLGEAPAVRARAGQ